MIKIKHPDPELNLRQEEMVAQAPQHMKRFHELLFTFGNLSIRYHAEADSFKPTEEDWKEWLEGLPENMRKDMTREGFEKCKRVLSFTRYVLEKNDIGMDEYIKQHMDPEDYAEYMSHLSHGKDTL